jgi:hypothetical protein
MADVEVVVFRVLGSLLIQNLTVSSLISITMLEINFYALDNSYKFIHLSKKIKNKYRNLEKETKKSTHRPQQPSER